MTPKTATMAALVKAIPQAVLLALVDQLGAWRVDTFAEWLCAMGERLDATTFRVERAALRSYAGDVDGALRRLAEAMPGERYAPLRHVHAATFCEQNSQYSRAAGFYEAFLENPGEIPISAEYRSGLARHVADLRQRATLAER